MDVATLRALVYVVFMTSEDARACIWKFLFKFGLGPLCGQIGIVRDYGFGYDLVHHSRLFEVDGLRERFGRGGRGRGPIGGNDDCVDELNGQGNNQGEGANGNVEGVNGGVGGAPDFSTIIAQQL
ncbi:hypothetical protein Tco_0728749 [Tanacetum coccineum]|uniref:Uncharacterized protein n=1 Tax=Tanacetum coccineum TaxID=301880 RepID=A0ABQ4YM37_9ASTR